MNDVNVIACLLIFFQQDRMLMVSARAPVIRLLRVFIMLGKSVICMRHLWTYSIHRHTCSLLVKVATGEVLIPVNTQHLEYASSRLKKL
jgi:hypothetical protein